MEDKTKKFLEILFNKNEEICVSPNQYSTHSVKLDSLNNTIINTKGKKNDKEVDISFQTEKIQLIAINPISGFRNDANVNSYRNFLIEMDTGSLEEQMNYVNSLNMPISACIFSGNKSLHFIISLQKDLLNKDAYSYAYKWILNILDKADKQVCTPSRGVRYPGNFRKETNKRQDAILLNDRVDNTIFYSWLQSHQDKKPAPRIVRDVNPPTEPSFEALSDKIKNQLVDNKIDFSEGRNTTWFKIALEFAKSGFSEENTTDILSRYYSEENDFKNREWLTCIKSAFRRIHG